MSRRTALAAAALLSLASDALAAEPACQPEAAELRGARFVRVCEAGGFWIAAAPLACTDDDRASAACDPLTALEVSPLAGAGKNGHVDARVTDAKTAARLCETRFGGRLPTRAEREAARRALGLVSLQVREEPGRFARLRLDEMPEWVAGGRLPEPTRPRVGGEVLLGCLAEPAAPQARWVPLGEVCDERPPEASVRSPGCALGLQGGAARFEIGCDPRHVVSSRSRPADAAVRCVVPEPPSAAR